MPIKTLQKRLAEIGRLRMGRQVPTRNGKTRPERLAEWRLTSPHQGLLEYARDLYGGTISPWQGAPTEHAQYELYTDSPALKVLIPPGQIVSQWMEAWSGGGCKRRCDGEREYLGDQPCLCAQETAHPRDYTCKPTTRLNVILRDVPAVGVWRLEIHGYYGAVELAGMAQLLEDAGLSGRLVPAELRIEQRTIKRPGEPPKHFAVPVLSPESAWIELAATQQRAALEAAPLELEAPAYDEETGELLEEGSDRLDGDPNPVQAVGPSVPTIEQIKKLRKVEDARSLVMAADDQFQQTIKQLSSTNDANWRHFWWNAPLDIWKDKLRVAVTETSGAGGPQEGEASGEPAPDSPDSPGQPTLHGGDT